MAHLNRLPTIWELPDDLWERLNDLINEFDPPKPTGRKRANARRILEGIIFRIRTGCQWNRIPKVYGDDATIHRTFQRWVGIQLFELIWSQLVAEGDYLGLVQWEWQAADGCLGKARSGGDQIGPNPTDRAKNGTKKSLLVDGAGGPWPLLWRQPMSMIICCWRKRWKPSSSKGRRRHAGSPSICALTPVTTMRRVGKLSGNTAIRATSDPVVPQKLRPDSSRSIRRGGGWLKERLRGSRSVAGCWFVMKRAVTTTSGYSSSRARCSGIAAYPQQKLFE